MASSQNMQHNSVHEDSIDNDLLIEEVEKTPVLYDKTLKEYSNIQLKSKGWEEICRKVFVSVWGNLSPSQKTEAGKCLQKRWKNIRACFSRELREQQTCQSGQAAKKRRKYKHFDQLLFLMPSTATRDKSGNAARVLEDGDDEEGGGDADEDEPRRVEHTRKKNGKRKPYERRLLDILNNKRRCEDKLIEVLERNKSECDGDNREKHFALSLVPMLKAVPEEYKLEVQIQILQVFQTFQQRNACQTIIRQASYLSQPGPSGTQYSQRCTQPTNPRNLQLIPRYSSPLSQPSPQNPLYINLTSPADSNSLQSNVSQYTPEPDDSEEIYDVSNEYTENK